MLNKKTLINNKNTKKSENKGLTPAVDMIGYTDIMINNTNKKDTMTKKVKNKTNPDQIAGAYLIHDSKWGGYKIGISKTVSALPRRIKALKIKYNYGKHITAVAKLCGKYSVIASLEKSLQEKYASVKQERKVKATEHYAADGSTYFTYDGCKLNGKNEWFVFNKEQVNDVLKNFKMA